MIRLRPELNLSEALEGLGGFTHLWVVFVFHQNTNKGFKAKVHPPRLAGEKAGVFATRSPHRPNPIGLSVVKIEKIEGTNVFVSGIDLVDGTPVLDLKPYIPSADRVAEARGSWTDTRQERFLSVTFAPEALTQIQALDAAAANRLDQANRPNIQSPPPVTRDLQALIRQTLELDPRPGFYKGTPGNENPYTDVYGFALEEFNVVYRVQGEFAIVLRLEPWSEWTANRRSHIQNE